MSENNSHFPGFSFPMADAGGHLPGSVHVTLSPQEGRTLADLTAGLVEAGEINPSHTGEHAVRWMIARMADARAVAQTADEDATAQVIARARADVDTAQAALIEILNANAQQLTRVASDLSAANAALTAAAGTDAEESARAARDTAQKARDHAVGSTTIAEANAATVVRNAQAALAALVG